MFYFGIIVDGSNADLCAKTVRLVKQDSRFIRQNSMTVFPSIVRESFHVSTARCGRVDVDVVVNVRTWWYGLGPGGGDGGRR